MLNNKDVEQAWGTVEVFIESMATLQAIEFEYVGTDYCKGMLYGIHGTRMLIQVGKSMIV